MFFSLDVEGHEESVLMSYEWSVPINTLLIEKGPSYARCEQILQRHGHIFIEDVAHNAFFVSEPFLLKNRAVFQQST